MTANNLTFDIANFVHRTKEIDIVRKTLDELENSSTPQPKSIAFHGEIGIGKSWLLQRLYVEFSKDKRLRAIYCDLKKYSGKDVNESVLDVICTFLGEEESIKSEIPLNQTSASAIQKIQDILKSKMLVAFIDHVYESDWKLLRSLEEYLLGPLAIESRTLFVLTGRGREYPWKTPELRLRTKAVELEPFSQLETKEQLAKISPDLEKDFETVYKNSHGNPLANSLMVNASREKFDQAIDHVLDSIPMGDRARMRTYLLALSVLRYFDEERIPTMLKAYDASMKQSDEYSQASKIRDELVRTAFARWDDERGGFVMDKYWQGLLSKYLELYENQKWLALHKAALELYKKWLKDYPTAGKLWEQEIVYHESFLSKKSHERNKTVKPSKKRGRP